MRCILLRGQISTEHDGERQVLSMGVGRKQLQSLDLKLQEHVEHEVAGRAWGGLHK